MNTRKLAVTFVVAFMAAGPPRGTHLPQITLSAPTELSQFRLNTSTPVAVRGHTEELGFVARALVTNGPGTRYRLAVEARPVGVAFTHAATAIGAWTDFGARAVVTVPLFKTGHHWQTWAVFENGRGPAVSYPTTGVNSESESDIEATYAGRIYYVSESGNDGTGAPDDPARPYRSLLGGGQGAYASVPLDLTSGLGDHVIQVMDEGTYGRLLIEKRITDSTHRVVLRAAAGVRPTIDALSTADGTGYAAQNQPALRIDGSHVVVQGFRFRNTSRDTTIQDHQVMVRLDGSHVSIIDSDFDGTGRAPTTRDIFLLVCNSAAENLIANNRFDYSGGKGMIYVGIACGSSAPGRQVIRNNVITRFGNNPQAVCAAINFGGSTQSLAGNGSEVTNNTIHDNGGGCFGILNTNGSNLTVRNNILSRITGHRYAIGCTGAASAAVAVTVNTASRSVARNTLFFGNDRDIDATCASRGWTFEAGRTADPMFVDPVASPPDLRLRCSRGDYGAFGTASLAGRACDDA